MGDIIVGDVVVVSFPFSDLSGHKLRPALMLAKAEFNNLILCQITSKPYSSKTAIKIGASDFKSGQLPVVSYVRPDKLFTAEPAIMRRVAGSLAQLPCRRILAQVRKQFTLD